MRFFERRSRRPGGLVALNFPKDYRVVDALDQDELAYYINVAISQEHIERTNSGTYRLTPQGWSHLMGPGAGGSIPGTCFVAMSFSSDLDAAYRDGIEPAVRNSGYDSILMKDVLTNDDVSYRMLLEIRKAQFVIADFTQGRAGVYFEAGFALGLGRPVLWTCRDTDSNVLHFDTNHYQHVVWTSPKDLSVKLYEAIGAVVGLGPHLRMKTDRR